MEIQDTAFRNKIEVFKQELLNNPDIIAVTNSTGVPGRIHWIQVLKFEHEGQMEEHSTILAQTDYDFVDLLGLEIVVGRNFDRKMGTDGMEAVLINEAAMREYGWEEDPIGKKIQYGLELEGEESEIRMMKVIGVVKDFHFRSLHNKIEPLVIFISDFRGYLLTCRLNPERRQQAVEFIESKWNEFNARRPFDYVMLDEYMDDMYQAEEKISTIFFVAAVLAIFIALLGLLGLSSFVAEQRTKEIGIRKVVGATVFNVLRQLYREFAVLMAIAFLIAIPLAWWRLDIWLDTSFVYHQSMHWSYFAIAGLLSFVVGFGTISFYILRAANANPVNAIKYE
jgi:putative ABC transport system permease protein